MTAARRTLLTLAALLFATAAVQTDDKPPAQDKDQTKAVDDATTKGQGFLKKQQGADEDAKKDVAAAIKNGQEYLKDQLRDVSWEHRFPGLLAQPGGVSCLAMLAL